MFTLRRVINYLYYLCTGIRVGKVIDEHTEQRGVLAALATFSADMQVLDVNEAMGDCARDADCIELAKLFTAYGSDKSTKHNYHLIYASLLKGKRNLPLRILEIGLGTNNVNVPSNMGEKGKPGASLHAFREWGSKIELVGADVDKGVLFSEERISTYVVDQTDPRSLTALAFQFPPHSFDLIIDDGLHTPVANLNSLNALFGLVKPGGSMVIEDILDRYLPIWKIALPLMPAQAKMVRCKSASVCIIQRP